jgi:hypothetical protein
MSSVLASIKQVPSKFLVGLGDSLTLYTMTNEDTATPTVSGSTVTPALGALYRDMGKVVVILTGDDAGVYRKFARYVNTDTTPVNYWVKQTLAFYDGAELGFARA